MEARGVEDPKLSNIIITHATFTKTIIVLLAISLRFQSTCVYIIIPNKQHEDVRVYVHTRDYISVRANCTFLFTHKDARYTTSLKKNILDRYLAIARPQLRCMVVGIILLVVHLRRGAAGRAALLAASVVHAVAAAVLAAVAVVLV